MYKNATFSNSNVELNPHLEYYEQTPQLCNLKWEYPWSFHAIERQFMVTVDISYPCSILRNNKNHAQILYYISFHNHSFLFLFVFLFLFCTGHNFTHSSILTAELGLKSLCPFDHYITTAENHILHLLPLPSEHTSSTHPTYSF